MESAIILEELLEFLPDSRERALLAAGMRNRDRSVAKAVEGLDLAAWDYYERLYDQGGGVADLVHYAWLMVEVGNYWKGIEEERKALDSYHAAWNVFTDPFGGRGHDREGDRLVSENPALMSYSSVAEYYKRRGEPEKAA